MEVRSMSAFLPYYEGIRQRTRRVVQLIPDAQIEWRPADGRFSFSDLVRHLASLERYMFAENVAGRPSRYPGHGRELADGPEAVRSYFDTLHEEALAIFRRLADEGTAIVMIEHRVEDALLARPDAWRVTAFAEARRAQAEWASWPVSRRMKVFKRFHALLLEHNETIVDLIQAESGKARRMAFEETCDVPMVISHYLKRAPKLLKPVKRGGPVPVVTTSTEIRQPKGVVGIIAPWNFPFATGLSDAVPALMAGNGIVLKPDNKTALSPLYGVSLLYEAGLPRGLFQVVCGDGPVAGPPVIDRANFVMFTGSTATGRFIGERAGRNREIELGVG